MAIIKNQTRFIVTLIFTVIIIFTFGAMRAECYAENNANISVYVDGDKVEFTQQPIVKDGRTLVPLRAIFEALGMTVDWEQSTKKITATDDDVTINLQVGTKAATVGNNDAGFIGTELDVAPQIIYNSAMVPARFIGEASGADVVWDNNTKSVMITSVPERKFISSEVFNAGYEKLGYAVWKTDRSFVLQGYTQSLSDGYVLDGFGKDDGFSGIYVGMYSNDQHNGFGTLIFESQEKVRGNFVGGEINYGEFIFISGEIFKGPIDRGVPNGKGIIIYADGTTKDSTYIYGKPQVETDPTKPHDSDGNLISVGDTVKKYTIGFDIFVGQVVQVEANKVLISWYDVQNIFSQSMLSYYYGKPNDFNTIQYTGSVTFDSLQWMEADEVVKSN